MSLAKPISLFIVTYGDEGIAEREGGGGVLEAIPQPRRHRLMEAQTELKCFTEATRCDRESYQS